MLFFKSKKNKDLFSWSKGATPLDFQLNIQYGINLIDEITENNAQATADDILPILVDQIKLLLKKYPLFHKPDIQAALNEKLLTIAYKAQDNIQGAESYKATTLVSAIMQALTEIHAEQQPLLSIKLKNPIPPLPPEQVAKQMEEQIKADGWTKPKVDIQDKQIHFEKTKKNQKINFHVDTEKNVLTTSAQDSDVFKAMILSFSVAYPDKKMRVKAKDELTLQLFIQTYENLKAQGQNNLAVYYLAADSSTEQKNDRSSFRP